MNILAQLKQQNMRLQAENEQLQQEVLSYESRPVVVMGRPMGLRGGMPSSFGAPLDKYNTAIHFVLASTFVLAAHGAPPHHPIVAIFCISLATFAVIHLAVRFLVHYDDSLESLRTALWFLQTFFE